MRVQIGDRVLFWDHRTGTVREGEVIRQYPADVWIKILGLDTVSDTAVAKRWNCLKV